MDTTGMTFVSTVMYEDRLREAEHARQIWRSRDFRKLPRLVQGLILILSHA